MTAVPDHCLLPAPAPPRGVALPRIARDHLVSLCKLVIDFALQPIVEVNTGRVYGFEALMRGHDRLSVASPTDLLDHAAQAGVLDQLERMLLTRAAAKFLGAGDHDGRKLFLNIDGRVLDGGVALVGEIIEAFRRHGVSPSAICVELSERHNNLSVTGFADIVRKLRGQGVRLAIDDFGVGFSDLRLLCDYGVDYVKIDAHFVRGIATDHRKRLFVRQIASLAHVLGVRVVAEGVETDTEYLACRDAGCDLVQGYFVARPTCDLTALRSAYPHVVTTQAQRRQDRRSDEVLVRSAMVTLPCVPERARIGELLTLFRDHPEERFFPIVDANGTPLGIVHERHLKGLIYGPYGQELIRNTNTRHRPVEFVTACPMVDINMPAERILDVFATANGCDGLIVTENMVYAGVLTAAAVLNIVNEKRIQRAQDQNPLTELPGNHAIADHVASAGLDGDATRHFCYFDFDHFKPFNDRYGFQQGDAAIRLFGGLMRTHLAGPGAFLGHVGGDDFFAAFSGAEPRTLRESIAALTEEFRREARMLYAPGDRREEAIEGVDRDGLTRRFPLMRCSVAVLEVPAGCIAADLPAIDHAIALAKTAAKKTADGLVWHLFADGPATAAHAPIFAISASDTSKFA